MTAVAAVAAACCSAAVLVAACGGASSSGSGDPTRVRVLQVNLCDSGIAGCYTGRSVAAAAGVIRAERPDLVTLNEVCRGDLSVLEDVFADAHPGRRVASAFAAAVDRRTGGPVRCRNGERYGIGLVARVGPSGRHRTSSGRYAAQDTSDPEERVWLCLHTGGDVDVCTTHLASTDSTVALQQCRHLVHEVIPSFRTPDLPVVVGADLNLRGGAPPTVASCVPPGFAHVSDGGSQDVVATGGVRITSSTTIDMHGTTDHPGLLADLALATPSS